MQLHKFFGLFVPSMWRVHYCTKWHRKFVVFVASLAAFSHTFQKCPRQELKLDLPKHLFLLLSMLKIFTIIVSFLRFMCFWAIAWVISTEWDRRHFWQLQCIVHFFMHLHCLFISGPVIFIGNVFFQNWFFF